MAKWAPRVVRELPIRTRWILGLGLFMGSPVFPAIGGVFGAPQSVVLVLVGGTVLMIAAALIVMPGTAESARAKFEARGYLKSSTVGSKNPWTQIIGGLVPIGLSLIILIPLLRGFLNTEGPQLLDGPVLAIVLFLAGIPALYGVAGVFAVFRGFVDLDIARHMRDEPDAQGQDLLESPVGADPVHEASTFSMRIIDVLPKRRKGTAVASSTHNVYDAPPLRLLFLWNFDVGFQTKQWWMKRERWSELGPVYMLTPPGRVPILRYLRLKLSGRLGRAFVHGPKDVARRLSKFDDTPLRPGLRNGRRGRYPVLDLLCTGQSWKSVVRAMCRYAHVVVLDARRYTDKSPGLSWELSAVVALVPTPRFVILADITTHMPRLKSELRSAWSAMPASSPNYSSAEPIRIVNTTGDAIEKNLDAEGSARSMFYYASQVSHLFEGSATSR